VHLHPAVSAKALSQYTAGADVGIYLIEASSLSYQLTVGNKVYEYMAAGIPVVGSDFPDVRAFLEHYQAGRVLAPDGSDFSTVVAGISKAQVADAKARLSGVWRELCWEHDAPMLADVYRALAEAQPGRRREEGTT